MIDPNIITRGAELAQLQQQQNMEALGNLGGNFGKMVLGRRINQMRQLDDDNERKAFANDSIFAPYLNETLKADQAAAQKAMYDQMKAEADIAKTSSEAYKNNQQGAGYGLDNSGKKLGAIESIIQQAAITGDPGQVLIGLNRLAKTGLISPEQYQQEAAIVKAMTPEELQKYAQSNALTNKEVAPYLYETKNNFANNAQSDINNQRTTQASIYATDTAASTADKNRVQQLTIENARIKAQQEGGSVMMFGGNPYFIDKKGYATAISHDTKGQPINTRKTGVGTLPTPALKMVTEIQGKVDETDLAITKLDKLLGNVDVANLGPWNNIKSNVKNLTGYSDQQSQAYERVVSGLKDAANALLLSAKGVQTDGDAQRAERIVMASRSNDPNVVKNAIEDLREFAEEIKLRHKNQIGGVYANYGLDPNEYFSGNGESSSKQTQPSQGSGTPFSNAGKQPDNLSKADQYKLSTILLGR